ncbi:hypothetical protein OH77DRAFT_1008886 [Trametes cingulata]|nr:hypothetical protein OH77DRAFT_1008886 [Trametes cingulata]
MPELDISHGYEYTVLRLKQEWRKHHWDPLTARLVLGPTKMSAAAEDRAGWISSCTVDDAPEFDYEESLEPPPEGRSGDNHDAMKSRGSPYARYLKPLQPGELFIKARGKEVVFAAGYHAVRVDFGREGRMAIVRSEAYSEMVSDGQFNIIAALVGDEHTLAMIDPSDHLRVHVMSLSRHWTQADLERGSPLWHKLWSPGSGPDWIDEREEAETVLDCWRGSILTEHAARGGWRVASKERAGLFSHVQGADTPSYSETRVKREDTEDSDDDEVEAYLTEDAPTLPALLDVMLNTPEVFNGYGPHTAQDLLYQLSLWPSMPPAELCADDAAFAEFKAALSSYAAEFVSPLYRTRCLGVPNGETSHHKNEDSYHAQFLKVFRKCTVRIPRELYNEYVKRGLFDPTHTIGEPYSYSEEDLIHVKYRDVPVYQFSDGFGDPVYSAICARRPSGWRYSGTSVVSVSTRDCFRTLTRSFTEGG